VGNIGGRIARIGQALGMEVTACDLVERYADLMYRPFEEAMSQADIIVAAMNVTPENINYFNYEKLRHVRQGALFINVARGELAVISDIERLLVEGRLGGVALDVYNREPELAVQLRNRSNAPSDPEFAALARMQQMDNVLLTPHNAFNTAEAVARKAEQSIRQIEHHRATGSFLWPCPM
jgi:D-lactate dehydrogenase